MGWEHFAHDADIGVRGFGRSLEEAFEQVGLALTAVVTELPAVACREAVEIACEADDPEGLLYDWLNSLVFEMATRGLIFGRFQVRIADRCLTATAWGELVERDKHHPGSRGEGRHVHGFAGRSLSRRGLVAECVVDV